MNSSVWAVWAAQAVRKKTRFEVFLTTFEGGFCGQKKLKNLKFIYSEKATVKSKGKISQKFVAFSEYMNFKNIVASALKSCLK